MNVLSSPHAIQTHAPLRNARRVGTVALRAAVGEIDVLVISDGVLPLPFATMSTNVDPASARLGGQPVSAGQVRLAVNVVVLRSGGQTILVDSGLGNQFAGFPRAGQLALRLEPPASTSPP